MRTTIFRSLAGILGVMFVAFLTFAERAQERLSLREQIGMWVVSLAFLAFAIFGEGRDSLLMSWFGDAGTSNVRDHPDDSSKQ